MTPGSEQEAPNGPGKMGGRSPSEIVSPWSCFHCRRRKARCDRCKPCSHCAKSGLDCSYPVSGRMPTRQHNPSPAQRPSSGEKRTQLINRLKYLENIVDNLSSQVRVEAVSSNGSPSSVNWGSSNTSSPGVIKDNRNFLNDFGRLHLHEGGSLYIGNKFWSMLNDEFKSVRQAFEDDDRQQRLYEEACISVPDVNSNPLFCNIRGRSSGKNISESQPLPSQIPYIWQIYVENVDPLIKILHVPTMEKIIRKSKGRFDSLDSGMRALMFSISLAAISSLSDTEVQENFHDCKDEMAAGLIRATEEALADAEVLVTNSVTVVQAFLLYLEVAGYHYGMRAIWTMTGILVRSAVSMGLHRDGSRFPNIDYFNAEIRRRLWWHICFIDNRVSQCDVPEMAVSEGVFDTREPANINDADIYPDMSHEPVAREGFTESSYMIAHCATWRQFRRLHNVVADFLVLDKPNDKTREQAIQCLERLRARLLEEFLPQPESEQALLILMRVVVEVMLDQMVLVVNHAELFRDLDASTTVVRHESFERAVRALEIFQKWKTDPSTRQWGWISVNYHPWHAACIVFAQLRFGPWNELAEKAWLLATQFIAETPRALMTRNPLKPAIYTLVNAATKHREEEMQKVALANKAKVIPASETSSLASSFENSTSQDEDGSCPMTWAWVSSDQQPSSCPGSSNACTWATSTTNTNSVSSGIMPDVGSDMFKIGSNSDIDIYNPFANIRPFGNNANGEISGADLGNMQEINQLELGTAFDLEEEPFNFQQLM